MKNSKSKITDIPESPFDLEVEDEIVTDDEYEGFDDEDERLTDEEIDMLINYQFDSLEWKKERRFDDLMKEGHPHTQRGFYCYVISHMTDEQLKPYIEQYVDWLERMNYKKELEKLPSEIKQDDLVMDLRKKQIEDNGKQIGTQIGTDLISLFNKIDNEKN